MMNETDVKTKILKTKDYLYTWVNLEFFEVNRNLVFAWFFAVVIFAGVYYNSSLNQQFLPGMTEAKEHIVNFKESVIVKEVLVESGQFVNKSDVLFILKRPDLELRSNKNAAELRLVVVEMNVLNSENHSVLEWSKQLKIKKENQIVLNPLEMRFLSLSEESIYLTDEKKRLKVLSPVSGHAGEVNFNVGETVAPYTKLISLFQTQPSIVKSYIPESFNLMQLNQNRSSVIKSMSRNHQGIGAIVSIGTMLTELPTRFQKDPMNKLFGREIKIALPVDNGFYLGEKVFVNLEGK